MHWQVRWYAIDVVLQALAGEVVWCCRHWLVSGTPLVWCCRHWLVRWYAIGVVLQALAGEVSILISHPQKGIGVHK